MRPPGQPGAARYLAVEHTAWDKRAIAGLRRRTVITNDYGAAAADAPASGLPTRTDMERLGARCDGLRHVFLRGRSGFTTVLLRTSRGSDLRQDG